MRACFVLLDVFGEQRRKFPGRLPLHDRNRYSKEKKTMKKRANLLLYCGGTLLKSTCT